MNDNDGDDEQRRRKVEKRVVGTREVMMNGHTADSKKQQHAHQRRGFGWGQMPGL
jgi:hypothetical protein